METGDEELYAIVGSQEANPMECRISDDSPFGKALLGHKVGDIIEVEAPIGELKYGDKHMVNNKGKIGPISQQLYDTLTGIQWGRLPDEFGWTVKVD